MRQSDLPSEEMGRFGGNVKDVGDFKPMRPVRPMMAKNPLFEVKEMVSDDIIFEGSNKADQACSSSFFYGVSHPPEPDDMDLVTAVCVPVSENKLDSVCLMKNMSTGHFIVPLKKLSQGSLSPAESIVEEPDEPAMLQSPFSTAHASGNTDNSQQQPDPERECVCDASLSLSGNASPHSSVDSMNFVCAISIATSPSESTQQNDVVLSMDKSYSDSSKGSISMVMDSFECTKRASDSSSGLSDESNLSNFSGSLNKPHRGNDPRWNSILAIRARDGILGMSHFKLLKRLGCGEIGSVYLSELSGTRCHFSMKVMDKASIENRNLLSRAQTEREILQLLDHPFLPTLYTHFETDRFSCLVMEYCPGGDLHTLRQCQPGKHFSEYAARFYAAEVLLALEYLHMIGVVYRDLKPENVLIRDDGHIMLSDFDLSFRCAASPTSIKSFNLDPSRRSFSAQPACTEPSSSSIQSSSFLPRIFPQKSKKNKFRKTQKSFFRSQSSPLPELVTEPNTRSTSFVGTHEYLAPEIIKGEVHGSAVDWWTFGIFLHELLYGKTPFKGLGNRATLFNVIEQHLKFPESPAISYASNDLIQALLMKDPSKRLGSKRGTTEIKQHPFFEGINWALIRCSPPPEIPRLVEETEPPPKYGPINPVELGSNGNKMMGPADMKPGGKFLDFEFF